MLYESHDLKAKAEANLQKGETPGQDTTIKLMKTHLHNLKLLDEDSVNKKRLPLLIKSHSYTIFYMLTIFFFLILVIKGALIMLGF